MEEQHKIFLGGTCAETNWRDKLIPFLEEENIDYFNPVVKDWTPECQAEEERQKKICDIHLYTITPKMKGVYSIAEVTDDSNKMPSGTYLCILYKDGDERFDEGQIKSLKQVARIVSENGGHVSYSLDQLKVDLKNRFI